MSNFEKTLSGLPLETYEWQLDFELDGAPADPFDVVIVITNKVGGVPVEIDRLDIDDLTRVSEGEYRLAITPETSGFFEVQIYTLAEAAGDLTVHDSILFNVPVPLGAYGED